MTENGGVVEQGQAVQLAPTDAELERAIASVPGVVSAGIDRSSATGRSRMRLRLAPGEDEEAVAWAVAATLRERFGIALDPDAIRPRPAAASDPGDDPVRLVRASEGQDAAPSGADPDGDDLRARLTGELAETRERLRLAAARALDGVADLDDVADVADAIDAIDLAELADAGRGAQAPGVLAAAAPDDLPAAHSRTIVPRAAIRDLQVQRDARSVQVTVLLAHGDRSEEGRAVSVPTAHGTLRAIAEATVAALRALTEGSLLVGIDRVSVKHGDDAPIATVMLSLLTRRGEERLLGASIIRDGPERAILRATLDALNRRVTPLLLDRGAGIDVPS
jgi:hypothetical protein